MPEQIDNSRSKTKLIILILMFLLPVAGSWYLVFFTDYARDGKGGAEHGNLIEPPRQLENASLLQVNEDSTEQASLYGKWSMLFFVDGSCEAVCEENLYRLRQIRLASGRQMKRLQRVAIIDEGESSRFRDILSENYPGQLYGSKKDLGKDFLQQFQGLEPDDKAAIFLVDTRGFLMMRYPGDTDPSGIIRDLSRLLRISG
jgi:cytochrome oxidase Cu insertion factor (SCO1/SenC/PrrC family)